MKESVFNYSSLYIIAGGAMSKFDYSKTAFERHRCADETQM